MADYVWDPKYIRQIISKKSGEVITADEWNNILNLIINQGDYTAEQVVFLTEFTPIAHNHNDIYYTKAEIDTTSTAVSLALEDKVDTSVFDEYSGSAVGVVAKADIASTAESIQWENIQDTPTEFTPTAHTHNNRYYTKTEIDDTIGDINLLLDNINGEAV